DLRLCLAPLQAKGMRLGDPASSRLGRTSFIGQPKVPPAITIRIRE
ncbi:type VI secretion system baseplate subunit TssG, partial [Escherichia coli]|nr:type VI secretion system baseplate subunit TssG [Escherichia coli]